MNSRRVRRRRGMIVPLTALMLIVMCAMAAFAVDMGYVVHARTELQRTADACALAALPYMENPSYAQTVAQEIAVSNMGTVGPELQSSDVVFGYWDRDKPVGSRWAPNGSPTNAVKVRLKRSDESGNPLQLFFGYLIGTDTANTQAHAIAMYDHGLCGPFVGIEWVSVPGQPATDSYSTEEGSYNVMTARDRGSLCSDGPIFVEGSALVRGDARAGKSFTVTLEGGAIVTGSKGSRLRPLNLPPVDASGAAVSNDNHQIPMVPEGNGWKSPVDGNGNFLLDGTRAIEMPPGTYYVKDFIVKGESQFHVSGPTTIYVTGNLERSGGTMVNNNTQLPANLQFLMTGGTAKVTSNNDFYGVIYAPNTPVTLDGDSDWFGAVVGKTLTMTGSGWAHYDESLNLSEVETPRRGTLVE